MRLIDERGRLFGLLNIIDAFLVLVLLGLIPLAFGAFVLFRSGDPSAIVLSPARIGAERPATVQLTGKNFRAYMTAWMVADPNKPPIQANATHVESATKAEITLPPMVAGTYDLRLLDGVLELARLPAALTVVAKPATIADVRVRFVALPEIASRVRPGDVDVSSDSTDSDRIVLAEIAPERQTVSTLANMGGPGQLQRRQLGALLAEQKMVAFTATVRMSVSSTGTGWRHHDRSIKAGAPFTFESATDILDGWILDVQVPGERAPEPAR